jgi:hypothetical protein
MLWKFAFYRVFDELFIPTLFDRYGEKEYYDHFTKNHFQLHHIDMSMLSQCNSTWPLLRCLQASPSWNQMQNFPKALANSIEKRWKHQQISPLLGVQVAFAPALELKPQQEKKNTSGERWSIDSAKTFTFNNNPSLHRSLRLLKISLMRPCNESVYLSWSSLWLLWDALGGNLQREECPKDVATVHKSFGDDMPEGAGDVTAWMKMLKHT